MIKALINRSADVSTHTPQDTKRKQPQSWAAVVSAVSVCVCDIGVPSYSNTPLPVLSIVKLLLLCSRSGLESCECLLCVYKMAKKKKKNAGFPKCSWKKFKKRLRAKACWTSVSLKEQHPAYHRLDLFF